MSPYGRIVQVLGERYERVSKEALASMVLDLLAEATGHGDDVTSDELLIAFVERHETLTAAGRVSTRLPARLREVTR